MCHNESITHGNFGILINKCDDVLNYFDDNLQIITIMARMLNAVQDVPRRIHYFDASFEVYFCTYQSSYIIIYCFII